MADAPEQLALGLRLRSDATFTNFLAAANETALHALRHWLDAGEGGFFYLSGSEGSGRSHLLQAACHEYSAGKPQKTPAIYLPLAQFRSADPAALLENLEQAALLCLDDIDAVTPAAHWCEALFHLCNRAVAAQGRVLVSAAAAPAMLDCALPDLRSRLAWGGSFHLHALDDDGRRQLLQTRARERGFDLNDEVAAYILSHHSRHLADLLALLDELDRQSLAQQKRITVPFVRRVLGLD